MRMDTQQTQSGASEKRADIAQPKSLPTVELCGRRIHAITTAACIQYVLDELAEGRGGWIVTHNLDHLRRLLRDQPFADLCTRATIAVADGMPLVWACNVQGTPIPERVAGSDLVPKLSAAAAAAGRSIFLLGGDSGTADAAAGVLRDRHPELKIAGTFCPEPGFEKRPEEMKQMTESLSQASPDVVFVALGSPKQEHVIDQLQSIAPGAWWLGVGISFSFLSGDVKRAPRWMQRCGLEWFHRLLQEPGRLARRYILQGIPFAIRLLAHAARHRVIGTYTRKKPGKDSPSAQSPNASVRGEE